MKLRRAALLTAFAGLLALGMVTAAPASAAPLWNLGIQHHETNFSPGGTGQYWFYVNNIGDTATSGPITLTVNLPPGLSRDAILDTGPQPDDPAPSWKCPGSPGDTTVTCTTTDSIPRHTIARKLILSVDVDPGASGDLLTTGALSGGGAPDAPPAAGCSAGVGACASEPTHIDATPAPFGIVEDSWIADFYQADEVTPVRRSGAHPDLAVFSFDLNSIANPTAAQPGQKTPLGNLRNLKVTLPPGFVGNPTVVGECTPAELSLRICPRSSQVGRADISLYPFSSSFSVLHMSIGIYNMTHPLGSIADLAFVVASNPVHVKASLDPASSYAITSKALNINESLPPFHSKVTIWGVPAHKSHDFERCDGGNPLDTEVRCETDQPVKPFLTVPSQCDVDHKMRLHEYDSWQNVGVFGPDIEYSMPGHTTDCETPSFNPSVEAIPTGKEANTPTGFDVHIKLVQNDNPNALNTPSMKSAVVTLPEGMSFSPSFADGLQSCTPAQIGLFTNDRVKCPPASRIGEVRLSTPVLPKDAVGSMYLAKQNDNPFNTTFALYMEVEDTEERGALIKIPGRIDVDPVTGQITTSFDDLPQFPVNDFTLKFRSGPRAPLVSPPACGSHKIEIKVASYAQPTKPVDASNTYEVSEGPGGSPCPPSSVSRPFAPTFSGGTLNPVAGTYSPFLFRLSRDDREQELSQVTTILPPGLVAKIAGIPYCPEAAIASISEAEGTGINELNNPACPAASQVGTVSAGLGAGPGPNYFGGKVYLAGPYKGAPLSLAVVAPGIAGPFDLGNVVVRAAVRVDPDTAQITAVSDPFPTILHGVILRARDIRLRVDRPETTLNPTNCEPMSIDGEIAGVGASLLTTADDSVFNASAPFQVGECAELGFKPRLSLRLLGGTKRGAHPKFQATLRMPQGGANISRASVALPRSEFLDQSHIGTVCTRVQFKANACPPASVYGSAVAKTPLLDEPLKGIAYLRSSDNPLPDLVIALRGQIDFNLVGRVDSIKGGIRNTFDFVPDAPVESFTLTMQGGKKGLLINSRNLCKKTYRATAKFNAQNGRRVTIRPEMQNSCGKVRKGKRR